MERVAGAGFQLLPKLGTGTDRKRDRRIDPIANQPYSRSWDSLDSLYRSRPRHPTIYNVLDMAWGPKDSLTDFRFQYFGSTLHLKVENAGDLRRVGELDEAHWVATSAPIAAINADPVFLELVDSDHDGRIGCSELRQAISWLFEHLKDYAGADAGNTALVVAAIRNESDEGRRIVETAIKILQRLGSTEKSPITLDQVRRD